MAISKGRMLKVVDEVIQDLTDMLKQESSSPSCCLLRDSLYRAGFSQQQKDEFLALYRKVTGANDMHTPGFAEFDPTEWSMLPHKMKGHIRILKLYSFKNYIRDTFEEEAK